MKQRPRHSVFRALMTLLVLIISSSHLSVQAASPSQSSYQVYLPVVQKPGSSPTTPPSSGPSSEELIATALKAGTIDRETALLYRVLAAFSDPRLPQQYQGAQSTAASRALDDAQRAFDTFSPANQAIIGEFLVRPDVPGSWEERLEQPAQQNVKLQNAVQTAAERWATTCKTSTNIKVWYHPYYAEDADAAREICDQIDGTIWPKLTEFIGHAPLSDSQQPNTGGDSRYDIYLVNANSVVVTPLRACQQTPNYMLVNRNGFTRSQLAELFMRALLFSHPIADCGEYYWLFWATTNWAMDFVYPSDNEEHAFAPGYMSNTDMPLDSFSRELIIPTPSPNGGNEPLFETGTYLWPFFLDRKMAGPDAVGALWDRSKEPNSLAMVNDAIIGGFARQWPAFQLANWNRQPVNDYSNLDGLPSGLKPKMDEQITLDGLPAQSITLDGAVKYLSAHAFHFTFSDPSVRSVAFANRYFGDDLETAHIDALVKIGGQWTQQDWSNQAVYPFCRDMSAERIEELVVIISNTEWQNRDHTLKAASSPLLSFTNMACRGWQAEVKEEVYHGNGLSNQNETVTSRATFERSRESDIRINREDYRAVEGSAEWTHQGNRGNCVGQGSGSYSVIDNQLTTGENTSWIGIDLFGLEMTPRGMEFTGRRTYRAIGVARKAVETTVTYHCQNQSFEEGLLQGAWLSTEQELSMQASDDGQTINGTVTTEVYSGADFVTRRTWTWTMKALPPE